MASSPFFLIDFHNYRPKHPYLSVINRYNSNGCKLTIKFYKGQLDNKPCD